MKHWHMATWIDGSLGRGARSSTHEEVQGRHAPLIDAWGAFATLAPHVPGDPVRWVCLFTCEVTHR